MSVNSKRGKDRFFIMSGIIKRRHTSQYAQIHNKPLQGDLKDLRAVGLLAHLMSLPQDWEIRKTQLQNEYSRRNVDAAFKELTEKNYLIGFSAYINGRKNYFYNVSDQPFTQEEFNDFVSDNVEGIREEGKTVKSIKPLDNSVLTIAQSVQYKECSTESAATKEIKTNKQEQTNTNNINIKKIEKGSGCQLYADIPTKIKNTLELMNDNRKGNEVWKKIIDSYVQSDLYKALDDCADPAPKLQQLLKRQDNLQIEFNQKLFTALKGSSRGDIEELKGYLFIIFRNYFNEICEPGYIMEDQGA